MFVGRIGFQQNFQTGFLSGQQKTLSRLQQSIQQSKVQNNKDTFTQSSHHTIYLETDKGVNRLTPLTTEPIPCRLLSEVHPESVIKFDKPSGFAQHYNYSEEDALIYQYYKKNCYKSWNVTSDKFVMTEDATEEEIKNYTLKMVEVGMNQFVRDSLKDTVTKEELENFRQELIKNGVDDEIDWWEVNCDSAYVTMGTSPEYLEQDIDYICSRYVALKNRIENQYTGEEKEKNMQILNEIYNNKREDFVSYYAKDVGSFFENLGQSGVSEDMKDSLNAIIDQKIAEYEDYIAKNENFASISNEEDTWLYQDDAFMAAQLRKSMAASKGITENIDAKSKYDYHHSNRFDFSEYLQNNVKGNITGENLTNKTEKEFSYSLEDLKFAGIYANTMQSYLDASYWGYGNKNNDTALGKQFAQEFRNIKNITSKLNIGENLKKTIEKTFRPFLNKLMDKIDKGIEENRKDPLFNLRFSYINRIAVFNAFSV